jgi:integrase
VPLTLRPPRNGKTPNFEIRGTYLGVRVETSSGTHKRSVALAQLRKIEDCIETHGQYPAPEPQADPGQPTFLSAAVAYMRDGGESRYVAFNLKHFRETLIKDIDQAALDTAAGELLSLAAPDYRNRKVYTPVIAILRHALGDKCPPFKRPAGSKGRERKDFMWPEDAFAIVDEAERIDPEFGLYLLLLLYAGIRKSEGINALKVDTRPEDLALWLRDSKNGDPRMLRLRQDVAERLQTHLKALPEGRERLFKFRDGGHFKHLLLRATMAACGLECPKRRPTRWKPPVFRLRFVTFHIFRHTWATWMRMYGGADLQGLAETKNWRDPRSVARYSHVVPRDEWARVDSLPAPGNIRGKAANE